MKIFFNGDSHTSGSELENPNTNAYSAKLATLLGGSIIANPSVGGASIERIIRTTHQYLNSSNNIKPDFIVIGWTEASRYDYVIDGKYCTFNSEDDIESIYKNSYTRPKKSAYHQNMTDSLSNYGISLYVQNQMYNLHCELEHLKIPHLFFNAHTSFFTTIKNITETYGSNFNYLIDVFREKNKRLPWGKEFWNPYDEVDGCFLDWAINRNHNPTIWSHHGVEAHDEFAKLLFTYINENNLIS